MNRKNFYIPLIFITSHLMGLVAGIKSLPSYMTEGTEVVGADPISGVYLLFMIGVATALMLLLLKFRKNSLIKIWFNTAIFLTIFLFFSTMFDTVYALITTMVLFAIRHVSKDLGLRNIIDIFAYAGAGALFGTMIGFIPALIFLFLLAIYDFVSVFITGHMIDLAKGGLDTETFMGIIYADKPPSKDSKIIEKVEETDEVKKTHKGISIVGGGDVIAPMIFSISLLKSFPIYTSLMTSIGSMFGLIVLMNYKSEYDFLPAIPTIAAFSILGFLLSLPFVYFLG